MQGLTSRQEQVLRFITESIKDQGYPPTLREIGAHMGIRSTNGVNDHLRALERKGYLTREDMKSRALRPRDMNFGATNKSEATNAEMVEIPVLGRVAAGLPLYAEEHMLDTVRIDRSLLKSGEIFTIMPRYIHVFSSSSKEGCVIEEISTESQRSDSFYIDKKINLNKDRKSFISF